jgi:hypothetical protein
MLGFPPFFPKYIRKPLFHFLDGYFIPINRNGLFPAYGTHIIQTVEMVGVGMGKENGVQPAYARFHCLQAELGPRVDESRSSRMRSVSAAVLNINRSARSFVTRIA